MARSERTGDFIKGGAALVVALIGVTCVRVATQVVDEPVPPTSSTATSEQSEPAHPPFIPPPEPGEQAWRMPDLDLRAPTFPYLPDEPRDVSRSIGGVVHGYLVESRAVPQPHPGLAFLNVQYDRGLIYSTDRMVRLLEGAAAHVRDHFPDSTVYLGNLGNPGGGDIPYSVSHNSGRDADLAFFLHDEQGRPAVPDDLVPLDENGEHETDDGRVLSFDPARNWRLVEGIIEAGGDQLQYIFVSNSLRRMLLEQAREVDAPARVVRRARALLHQPYGALPHNDHFHVRIYCSKVDVKSGCWDRGTRHAWYDHHASARWKALAKARELVAAEEASVREAALHRLALLEDEGGWRRVADRLEDQAPVVRAAAARTLGALNRGAASLAERLPEEQHPQVLLEIVDALGRLGGRRATRALTGALDEPRVIRLPGRFETDLREFVAESLIDTERADPVPALLTLLEAERAAVRAEAARALRYLTNHSFGERWAEGAEHWQPAVAKWKKWWETHHDKSREAWMQLGFVQAGYEVEDLDGQNVWGLCRAIEDADHLSYNAQRVLMGISGREPASLSWPKHDASFYWRRWFERRHERFGAPPIPRELSTLE